MERVEAGDVIDELLAGRDDAQFVADRLGPGKLRIDGEDIAGQTVDRQILDVVIDEVVSENVVQGRAERQLAVDLHGCAIHCIGAEFAGVAVIGLEISRHAIGRGRIGGVPGGQEIVGSMTRSARWAGLGQEAARYSKTAWRFRSGA